MVGEVINNYKLVKELGEGGMGSVFLGEHTFLQRQVAIKMLNPLLAKSQDVRERFRNEASTLSHLQHPNIVTLYDYIEQGDHSFLIMEYADGKPMDDYINTVSGPVPEHDLIHFFAQILEGIGYAHSQNIVHRDIKPSNFIITRDKNVKILDFGIAKILGDDSHKLTKTGQKVGTILYMSPEQVKGQTIDHRTDIYSLGVTLFQMATGHVPYDEDSTEFEIYSKIVNEPLPNPSGFYIGVSDKIHRIIQHATQKDPAARFQTCHDIISSIRGNGSQATPPPPPPAAPQQAPAQSQPAASQGDSDSPIKIQSQASMKGKIFRLDFRVLNYSLSQDFHDLHTRIVCKDNKDRVIYDNLYYCDKALSDRYQDHVFQLPAAVAKCSVSVESFRPSAKGQLPPNTFTELKFESKGVMKGKEFVLDYRIGNHSLNYDYHNVVIEIRSYYNKAFVKSDKITIGQVPSNKAGLYKYKTPHTVNMCKLLVVNAEKQAKQ